MTILKIENNYSWVLTENDELKTLLWKAMRHKARNYFHNARYKMKLWDGYDEYFKRDSGRFLTGLLPEVAQAIAHVKVPYEVDDRRNKVQFAYDVIGEDFLNNWAPAGESGVKLRDYQVEYINQAIKHKRGIITSPTGSGKTNCLIGILKALGGDVPTLVLANKKSLVEQNYKEIMKWGFVNVGRFYSDYKEPNMITCSTVQSAHLLKPILPKIKVLIVDEVHEMMSRQPKAIYSALKACSVRIGMSATAMKFGGTDRSQKFDVKGWIGPVFMLNDESNPSGKLTTKELQERDILSHATNYFIRVTKPRLDYEIYMDAVTKGIAENDHFHDMVAALVKPLPGRTLIIVDRLEHGERLRQRLPDAEWVRGEDSMSAREMVIERLKTEKKVVAIATAGIFNTGINVFCHTLVNAAGGQADHQIVQRYGRGLRVTKDKDGLLYFDFLFENNEYLQKHSNKRVKILEKEGHIIQILDEDVVFTPAPPWASGASEPGVPG